MTIELRDEAQLRVKAFGMINLIYEQALEDAPILPFSLNLQYSMFMEIPAHHQAYISILSAKRTKYNQSASQNRGNALPPFVSTVVGSNIAFFTF